MNKSPEKRKKKETEEKSGKNKNIAKPDQKEGSGIGGSQIGTNGKKKPAGGKPTSREVRDLG